MKPYIHLTLFLFGFCLFGQSKKPNLHFRHYNVEHGLSSNRISSIIQDSLGFIWIGTNNGLNRFDGLKFKLYTSNDTLPHSLRSRVITSLLESQDKKIWVGTDRGIDWFDPEKDTFVHFDQTTEDGSELNASVIRIIQDKAGEFWFATRNQGLYRFSPQTQRLTVYKNTPADPASLSYNTIWDLFEDSRGFIWVGTSQGGLCRFSKETATFTIYRPDGKPGCLNDVAIHKIFEDSSGRIWIGTFNNGIALYNPKTETFTHFLNNVSGRKLVHIHDINEYAPGLLMISSDEGIVLFDTNTYHSFAYESALNDPQAISDNSVYTIFRDREEGFWIGTYYGGINYCSHYLQNFVHYQHSPYTNSLNGNVVSCFAEDGNGRIWIGTDEKGITQFDVKKQYFEPLPVDKRAPDAYFNVQALLYENNRLWIGTYTEGLQVLDLKTNRLDRFPFHKTDSTTIPSPNISALCKAGDGKIYIGTDHGACVYDPDKNNFEQIHSLDRNAITKIVQDGYGYIWFSTSRNGVFKLDTKIKQTIHYQTQSGKTSSLVDNDVITICLDKKKRLWFGTRGGGFCRYEYASETFIRYDDVPLPDKVINCIFSENDYLWLATNNCIVRFRPETKELFSFSRSRGLLCNEYTEDTGLQTADGSIYFGGVGGFDLFHPQHIVISLFNPPVVITQMRIFDQEITASTLGTPLKKNIEYASDPLKLSFDQSVIGFEFTVLSYIAPDENRIAYKLEGFDKQWYFTNGGQKQITYTSLPAGNYMLKVRNDTNHPDAKEIRLPITITPPFYKSATAFVLYSVFILLCFVLFIHYFFKRSEKAHQEKINRLRIEQEKEIYETKLTFFTNIAHEIRTPLSLITGPLEYITKAPDVPGRYGNYLHLIDTNCTRLLNLVNQLLDFRKIEKYAYEVKYTSFDLKTLTQNIVKPFLFMTEQNNISLQINYSGKRFHFVSDEEVLTKIINNLLTNALKYTQDSVTVAVHTEDSPDVRLVVSDNGPGISDVEKKKIFELFYQIKPAEYQDRKAGIGIGLHLTRMLVDLLDGQMRVEDNPDGKGVSFIVQLVLREASPDQPVREENETGFLASTPTPLERKTYLSASQIDASREHTIMVVDDHPDIRSFLCSFLSEHYFVMAASDAEEAFKMLENNIVHLIISDIMMPGIDGYAFCRKVKDDLKTSHIPVILLTAKTDLNSKIEGLETGADAYVEKPFSPEYLHVQIKNLLQQRRVLQEKFANSPLIAAHTVIHSKADEDFIEKVNACIHAHLNNPDFQVDRLAEALCMSRSTFFTKIKAITGMTPNDFIRVSRLKEAARLIKAGEYRVNEICFLTGFNSPSYFAKCFNKQFDMLPSEFIHRCKEKEV